MIGYITMDDVKKNCMAPWAVELLFGQELDLFLGRDHQAMDSMEVYDLFIPCFLSFNFMYYHQQQYTAGCNYI